MSGGMSRAMNSCGKLYVRGKEFDFSRRTYVMGILNVTPDSFFDGNKFFQKDEAIAQAIKMVEQGADIVDVGGESTRPGAKAVGIQEELERVLPVIRGIRAEVDIPISIDTYKPEVARAALEEGADMVNDIMALKVYPEMAKVIAHYNVPVVLMHMKGTPPNMQESPVYDDLIGEIIQSIRGSIRIAIEAGIDDGSIVIDPGIGFGKTTDHNIAILNKLSDLKVLGCPILIGTSRKSFLGQVLNAEVQDRIFGTAASIALAVERGANIVRVHDVQEMSAVIKVIDMIIRS